MSMAYFHFETMRCILCIGLLMTWRCCAGTEFQTQEKTDFDRLVVWIKENGGRVDDRLGLVIHNHKGQEVRGGVALADIEADTELLFLPWKLVLGTTGDTATVGQEPCEILDTYAQEVRMGKDSFWFPYLKMDDSISSRIPTIWNKSTLEDETQGLPPFDRIDNEFSTLADWFSKTCKQGHAFQELDGPSRQSLLAVVTRAAGMRFLPLLDLLNHHNGLLNTSSHADEKGNTLRSSKKIQAGDEIFHSYRGGRGTSSELFRQYGFIESWPQQWAWTNLETGKESIRFLLLPHDVVVLSPLESMTDPIGSNGAASEGTVSLENFQTQAETHNMGLQTKELEYIHLTINSILNPLPTDYEEDQKILSELMQGHEDFQNSIQSGKRDHQKEEQYLFLADSIHAIQYRMHVKLSLMTALKEVDRILLLKQKKSDIKIDL